MRKWAIVFLFLGGVIMVLFIFLPLYLPENPLSGAMMTPLFCGNGETYLSETTRGVNFSRQQVSTLNAYCVSTDGTRRDVSAQQVNVGLIAGGIPLLAGILLLALGRFMAVFRQAVAMSRPQPEPSPFNPTNPEVRFSKPPGPEELGEELNDPRDSG